MMERLNVAKGFLVSLQINEKVVAGGISSALSQTAEPLDVSDLISIQWSEFLSGLRNWSIQSQGVYVLDEESLSLIEQTFISGDEIQVAFSLGGKNFKGTGIITSFPINTTYNDSAKYSIRIQGTGALTYE